MKKLILLILFIVSLTSAVYAENKNCFYEKDSNTYYYDSYGATAKDRWVLVDDTPYFANEKGIILKNTFTPDIVYVDAYGKYKYNKYVDISLQSLDNKNDNNIITKELIENKSNACLVLKSIDTYNVKTGFTDTESLNNLLSLSETELNKIIDNELAEIKKDLSKTRSLWIVIRYTGRNENNFKVSIAFTKSVKGDLRKPTYRYNISYDTKSKKLKVVEPKNKKAYVNAFKSLFYSDNLYYYEKNDVLARNKSAKVGKATYKFNENGEVVKDDLVGKIFTFDDAKYYIKTDKHYAVSEWTNINGKETGFSFDAKMLVNQPDFNQIYLADSDGHKVFNNWIVTDDGEYHNAYYADGNGYVRISLSFSDQDMNEGETCHFCNKADKTAELFYHHDFSKDQYIENKINYKNETYHICIDCYKKQRYKNLIKELDIK